MALTTSLDISVSNTLTKVFDLSTPSDGLSISSAFAWVDGTGDDEADLQFHDQRTVLASANDDLDLAGSLVDVYGDTITFARIKAMLIINTSSQAFLEVKPGASNGWDTWINGTTPNVSIPPGGAFLLVAPKAAAFPVTAGTGDILRITNTHASVDCDYKILLIGASV